MNKNTIVSVLFVILTIIVAAGSIYLVLSYATDMLNAIVSFVSSNDLSKVEKCGMTIPAEFMKLRTDLASLILPFLYIGMPAILIVVGVLMFLAGFYHHKSRFEDENAKKEQMEREMVHKLVKKIGVGAGSGAQSAGEPSEPEEESGAGEPEAAAPEEVPPEPEEAKPAAKTRKKRK